MMAVVTGFRLLLLLLLVVLVVPVAVLIGDAVIPPRFVDVSTVRVASIRLASAVGSIVASSWRFVGR